MQLAQHICTTDELIENCYPKTFLEAASFMSRAHAHIRQSTSYSVEVKNEALFLCLHLRAEISKEY